MRLASAIEPEWLLDLFPDRLREVSTLEWNRGGERVEAVTSLMFDQIAIETRRTPPDPEAGRRFPGAQGRGSGAGALRRSGRNRGLPIARPVRVASMAPWRRWMPPRSRPRWRRSPPDSRASPNWNPPRAARGLLRAIEQQMPPGTRRLLDEIAPPSIRLPRGRQVPVHYEPDQPPWIASRLQDFFGMRETPTVGRGAVPVVVRLLAPNQRPVQMTSDLAGFWQRLYPQVRKELSRRYPKHAWPENPLG